MWRCLFSKSVSFSSLSSTFPFRKSSYKLRHLYKSVSLLSPLVVLFCGSFILAYHLQSQCNKFERVCVFTKSVTEFMLIWQLSKSVSSLIELWHRFQASLILMKWNNCFPLVSPDELEGCRCYWTPHLSWFNYNCKLFQYFEHLNQVGLIIITFQLHLQDEIK